MHAIASHLTIYIYIFVLDNKQKLLTLQVCARNANIPMSGLVVRKLTLAASQQPLLPPYQIVFQTEFISNMRYSHYIIIHNSLYYSAASNQNTHKHTHKEPDIYIPSLQRTYTTPTLYYPGDVINILDIFRSIYKMGHVTTTTTTTTSMSAGTQLKVFSVGRERWYSG